MVSAQKYGEIGVSAGGSYYLGDLNPGQQFLLTKPAFGAFVRHNFNERVAIKGAVMFGSVEGDDLKSKVNLQRGLNFQSKITDIAATFEFNFFDYFIGSLRHYVTPYMYAGGSVLMFNPKASYNGTTYELHGMNTEGQGSAMYPERKGYNRTVFAIPFGVGIKYSLGRFVGASLDWSMRKTFTDYIDDVSTTYYLDLQSVDPGSATDTQLTSDPALKHRAGMQRGNDAYNDWISFVTISISLRLNYLENERCLNPYY
ncbi:hypothetical protein MASR1M74_13430 [Lentimicrobium sp.]